MPWRYDRITVGKKKDQPPDQMAALFGVGHLRRHLFICLGPDCVDRTRVTRPGIVFEEADEGAEHRRGRWSVLSHEVRVPPHLHRTARSASSIPRGAWYRPVTPENAERIIQEHLLGGQIVEICASRVTRSVDRRHWTRNTSDATQPFTPDVAR